jgi:hypothetical protein
VGGQARRLRTLRALKRMIMSVGQLQTYTIRGTDEEIGKLRDAYFDDLTWQVLFLVVETGPWLLGRFVLISPTALGDSDTENRAFPTTATRAEVDHWPGLEAHQPVSRQHAVDVAKYWDRPFFPPGDPRFDLGEASNPDDATHDDPHLRAAGDMRGHQVQTPDGPCGHIEDWLVDLDSWTVREAVINTTHWWPGESLKIPCTEITRIDWDRKSVHVRLGKEAIERIAQAG